MSTMSKMKTGFKNINKNLEWTKVYINVNKM